MGNTTTWAALNNMPPGTMAGNWIGMYNGLQGGRLEKTKEAWIWSYSFEPIKGLTYNWNPGVWINAARTENHLQHLHVGRNLRFSVSSAGQVSGEVTLRIKSKTSAVVEQEQFYLNSASIRGSSGFIYLAPNPAKDVVHIFSPYSVQSVQVIDMNGKMIIDEVSDGSVQLGGLPGGSYLVKVVTSQGLFSRQLIVE